MVGEGGGYGWGRGGGENIRIYGTVGKYWKLVIPWGDNTRLHLYTEYTQPIHTNRGGHKKRFLTG